MVQPNASAGRDEEVTRVVLAKALARWKRRQGRSRGGGAPAAFSGRRAFAGTGDSVTGFIRMQLSFCSNNQESLPWKHLTLFGSGVHGSQNDRGHETHDTGKAPTLRVKFFVQVRFRSKSVGFWFLAQLRSPMLQHENNRMGVAIERNVAS
jgi:hypothetical protein